MQHDNKELEEIKATLIQAHPYYKHEYKNVILKAIGEYFNGSLHSVGNMLWYNHYKRY